MLLGEKMFKKIKILKYALILLGAFLFGIIWAIFFDNDLFYKMSQGFKRIGWYAYPLLLIGVFYVTLIVHELTHMIAFLVTGTKAKAIYITGFVFMKKNNKWKFKFIPKMFALFGGLVVPDIGEIKNENEYQKVTKSFSISLISAPIASLVFGLLTFIAWLLLLFLTNAVVFIAIITIFMIFTTLFTILYTLASLVATNQAVGDFPAYKRMKSIDLFQISILSQYLLFSSNLSEETESFIFDKSNEIIIKQNDFYNQNIQSLLISYIDGIVFEEKPRIDEIDKIIEKLNDTRLLSTEAGKLLYFSKLYFLYALVDSTKAISNFRNREESISKMQDVKYQYHKTLHIMNISDESEYLNNKENVSVGKMSFVFEPLIDYFEEEQKTIIKLTPKIIEVLNVNENQ